jgi:type VI secretion system protein ImpL
MSDRIKKAIIHKWVIQWVGIIACGVLLWWGGPMITVAGKAPLDLVANRLLVVLLIVIIWLVYHLVTQTKANQTDLQLMAELSVFQENSVHPDITELKNREASEIKHKFQSALKMLKETQSREKFNQQYLYKLPWYMIIGAPGSGKTTLLSNSGIYFPVKNKSGQTTVKGIGGTRNCNWLFSDEAIFIDTAGRYTTQDSEKNIDAAGWEQFLNLLKKYRPQRPVNGVLFTLSLSDLLTWSEEELDQYARTLRQRALELYDHFNITIPIYLLLTKSDLVAGFTEYFDDLGPEERKQVWGFTFPADTNTAVKTTPDYLEKLQDRLQQKRLSRVQQERDLVRRGLIINFPQQFELLKPLLMRFLKEIFHTNHPEPQPFLRGIYFTSGTQEGTPIDRVMSGLAGAFGLNIQKLPMLSGHVKSFFISKLLKEVILPESELAGVDLSVMRQRTLLRWAINGVLVGLITILIILWSTSYTRNNVALNQINDLLDHYETLQIETSQSNGDSKQLLERLNTIASAQHAFSKKRWWEGFGLYQGKKLQWEIQRIYQKLLLYDLIELIKRRLEYNLKQYISSEKTGERKDPSKLYQMLKVYLMLGMPEKMAPSSVYNWAKVENENIFSKDTNRKMQLQSHLDRLFKLPLDALPLNYELITQARNILNASPFHLNLYANLKSQMLNDTSRDFYLKDVIDPNGLSILATKSGRPAQELKVPGWYTLEGFQDDFETKGVLLIQKALKENWVLKRPIPNQKAYPKYIYTELQKLYFDDYKRHWRNLLNNLKLKRAENLDQTIHIADTLAGPETPFIPILMALKKHTGFVLSSDNSWYEPKNTQTTDKSQALPQPAQDVADHFQELTELVQPVNNQPPSIDRVLFQLAELRDGLLKSGSYDVNDIIRQSRQEFSRLPEPLKSWLMSLLEPI